MLTTPKVIGQRMRDADFPFITQIAMCMRLEGIGVKEISFLTGYHTDLVSNMVTSLTEDDDDL